jgi:quercetin dioxygenase-like cupin family protein
MRTLLLLLSFAFVQASAQDAKVNSLVDKLLPDIPGREAQMIAVEYPPGGYDAAHRHNADVFVYVLQGSVIMGVKGGKPVTLTAGQTFYEGPNDIHTVGRNASKTEPARLLVFLVKKNGAPIMIPVKQPQ